MAAVLLAVLPQLISNAAAGPDATMENRWLMMVTTQSTDPVREAEFIDWYDRIDIPDVLEVPGYMRARRGQGQRVPELPNADLQDDEGKYIDPSEQLAGGIGLRRVETPDEDDLPLLSPADLKHRWPPILSTS